ncbi:hypothetical protein L1987_01528 [Smallanthus sonchifolius]|uniref:Uncharacterized protein n=1 Tax=Smallanthus sonchifolius TaxID=185202 RepID=A0ACB9K5D2_9ASTR|nr:hypothetical protein L1987_01528 [Smallanthus sonchifolius]
MRVWIALRQAIRVEINSAGICAFRDKEEINRGEELKPEIERAIKAYVRKQKGSFAVEKDRWKTALTEVVNLSGFTLSGYEAVAQDPTKRHRGESKSKDDNAMLEGRVTSLEQMLDYGSYKKFRLYVEPSIKRRLGHPEVGLVNLVLVTNWSLIRSVNSSELSELAIKVEPVAELEKLAT